MPSIESFASLTAASLSPRHNNSVKKAELQKKSAFFRLFDQADSVKNLSDIPFSEQAIQELLDEIHSSGDALKNRPFVEEIIQYKKAVRDFLHYVVKKAYRTERSVSGANLARRKRYTVVQIVDQKLEQLAAGILAGQTNQVQLLAKLEEIKGLLVDMLQ
ncbi:MAG: DUF327 family protein [Treponema sp.]|jgi:uncharacterized protein YaaR (DUF327 family)|nr:DUF327 family protein [Treponema sp.]